MCGQILVDTVLAEESAASERAGFAIGAVVAGRYTIKEIIGQGGVGTVYKAFDKEREVEIALKAISPNLLQTEDERRLFSQEMRAARKLSHVNIVRVYSEGAHQDRRFYTMKLLDGLTLRKVIQLRHEKGQAFEPEEIVPIFTQVASALDYAHKTTWHGDLKPENILILPDLLKITDFHLIQGLPLKPFLGIVKAKSTGFPYVAPEVRVEANQIDGRCDIFSLGVILAEILTGVVFDGQFTRLFTGAIDRLPKDVESIIRKCLQEHPDNRYKKSGEVIADLQKAFQGIPNGALPAPVVQASNAAAQNKGSQRATPPPPPLSTFPGGEPISDYQMTNEDGIVSDSEIELISDGQIMSLEASGDSTVDVQLPSLKPDPDDDGEEDEPTAVSRGAPIASAVDDEASDLEYDDPSMPGPALEESEEGEIEDEDSEPDITTPAKKVPPNDDAGAPPALPIESEEEEHPIFSEDILVPPPLPDEDSISAQSGSFDSLPAGVLGVAGQSSPNDAASHAEGDDDSTMLAPAPQIPDDDDFDDNEPTFSGKEKVGIYDELTALQQSAVREHKKPEFNDPSKELGPLDLGGASEESSPSLSAEHEDVLERSSPRLNSAEVLAPPTAVPKGAVAPSIRPVAPPQMVKSNSKQTQLIAAGVALLVIALGVFLLSGKTEEKKEAIVKKPDPTPGLATIGPAGGTIELDGVSFDFPQNAVETEVTVRMEKVARQTLPGYVAFSGWYRFIPEDLVLKSHGRIHFPYKSTVPDANPVLVWVDASGEVTEMTGVQRAGALSIPIKSLGSGFVGGAVAKDATQTGAEEERQVADPVETQARIEQEQPEQPSPSGEGEATVAMNKKKEEEREAEEREAKERERLEREAEETARREMERREEEERLARNDSKRIEEERETARRKKREEAEREKAERQKAQREEQRAQAKEEQERQAKANRESVAMVKLTCPKGMARIDQGSFTFGSSPSDPMRNFGEKSAKQAKTKTYCIDYYEYPNSSKKLPKVGVTFAQAKRSCSRRGKRLCTEQEWERACKGPKNRRFPYGNRWDSEKCNTESEDGVARDLSNAKAFKKCRSGYNIFSMSGNAEEWTADAFRPGSPSKVVKGGAADRPDWASRCAARRGLSGSARKSTLGFRCCADPE